MKYLSLGTLLAVALMLSACGGGNEVIDTSTTQVSSNPVDTGKDVVTTTTTSTTTTATTATTTTMTRDQIYLKINNEEFPAVTGTFQEFDYSFCDYGGGTSSIWGGLVTFSTTSSSVDCEYDSIAAFADDSAGEAAKKAELLGYLNNASMIASSGDVVTLTISTYGIAKIIKIDFSKPLLAQPTRVEDYSDRTIKYLIQ